MKKLLLLLLIAPVLGFGQVLTDVFYEDIYHKVNNPSKYEIENYDDKVTVLEVPQNKVWKIVSIMSRNFSDFNGEIGYGPRYNNVTRSALRFVFVGELNDDDFLNEYSNFLTQSTGSSTDNPVGLFGTFDINKIHFIPQGTRFTISGDYYSSSSYFNFRLLIYEYTLENNSLSSNYPETIQNNSNTPVLFPNPTSSLLALNSDKEYDIEVYDMAGNKVMALTGNNINMEHLSTATYIVKATDKSNNEELTYKVVKN